MFNITVSTAIVYTDSFGIINPGTTERGTKVKKEECECAILNSWFVEVLVCGV